MTSQRSLRTGAVLLLAGALLTILSNAVQPRIGDYTDTAEVFGALAATPLWEISRIGVLFAALLGAGGILVLVRSLRGERGELAAQLALASTLAGVPVIAVMMGLDLAQYRMAHLMLNAPPEQSTAALWAGHALHSGSFAVFTISLIVAGGVTPILLGLGLILGIGYARWIGWASLVGGIGVLVAAVLQAVLGPTGFSIGILMPVFGLLVVVSNVALAVLMWRRGRDTAIP
jgi:hypothetical protein